ncbi:hypothetical protein NP493_241g02038 [Ridgeia piscesae]|uniref:Galaxin-like repeats domain-containing protein n=1 Tax=Ridgeia piscesae TaxID=27915 RepID=A0AAD9NZG4_RIDPI|nr:hypothetical protein NP493_241g02038 [Ridgeia piscesae]
MKSTAALFLIAAVFLAMADARIMATLSGGQKTCGNRPYNPGYAVCCGGQILNRRTHACCGYRGYSTTYELCCGWRVVRRPWFGACCGAQVYDSRRRSCCGGIVIERWERCCNGRAC